MYRKLLYTLILVMFAGFVIGQNKSQEYQYALIEAVKQKNLGNIPGAVDLYEMVIEVNDSVAVAHYELGTLYAMAGQKEKALSHLEKANELEPGNVWYINAYFDVLLMTNELKTAEQFVDELIKTEPESVDFQYKLANVLFLREKEKKALAVLKKMELENGFSDKVSLLKANIYEKRGEFDKARFEMEHILEYFPESAELLVVAAELAVKGKNEDKAAAFYNQVLEIDSLNIYALTNLTDYYRKKGAHLKSLRYMNLSFLSDEIDFDKKMTILSYYLNDEFYLSKFPEELDKLVETMLLKYAGERDLRLFGTDFYIQRREYSKALETIRPLLIRKEKNYHLWRQGILLANASANSEATLQLASTALEIFPDSSELNFYKGLGEYEEAQYQDVLNTYSKDVLSKFRDQSMIYQARILLAEAYHSLGQYTESDVLFREVIEEGNRRNYAVMNNFAYYLSERGEFLDEAKILGYEVISNNPDNATFLDTYAWIMYKLGNYTQAYKYISLALTKGGQNDPDVNEHAADICYARGNYEEALEFYQRAIILGAHEERLLLKIQEINVLNEE